MMIHVYFDESLKQVLFTPNEEIPQGIHLGQLDELPSCALAFVADSLLRKNGILTQGISVVVADSVTKPTTP